MAPYPVRQLLAWSLPSVAVLLSYLWYKKRKIGARSDTGGARAGEEFEEETAPDRSGAAQKIRIARAQSTPSPIPASASASAGRKFSRSLSGVESAPIDIVYPKDMRSSKSSPVIISDEDLDIEIEKIKSMRNQYSSPSTISAHLSKTPSPNNGDTASAKSRQLAPEQNGNCVATSCGKNVGFDVTPQSSPKPSEEKMPKGKKQQPKKKSTGEDGAPKEDVAVAVEKVSALKVSGGDDGKEAPTEGPQAKAETFDAKSGKGRQKVQRRNSGRDSANHSPSDAMMASPSLSSMSDDHSEGSSDSGKGGSDVATPPPSRAPNNPMLINVNVPMLYEFVIPQNLAGKMIGKQGCFVQSIKDKSNAYVYVRKHPNSNRLKVCSVEGTEAEIDTALKMIRDKFPLKKYAEVTLEQVQFTPIIPTVPLIPDCLYLKLVEGINNDTILSCMVAPDHLFMQQPTHPTFPNLNMLTNYMNACYSASDSPLLPSPIPENTVCAAFSIGSWYRAMVLSTDDESETSYVKFLDYGGYAYVENDKLRQIRQDFMLLPFQAAECFLSNVKPKSEDGAWPEGAYNLVADVTKGSIIYTQVADYTPDGVPVVLCYVVTGPRDVVFLNQRLVDEGFASWVPFEDLPPAPPAPEAAVA